MKMEAEGPLTVAEKAAIEAALDRFVADVLDWARIRGAVADVTTYKHETPHGYRVGFIEALPYGGTRTYIVDATAEAFRRSLTINQALGVTAHNIAALLGNDSQFAGEIEFDAANRPG